MRHVAGARVITSPARAEQARLKKALRIGGLALALVVGTGSAVVGWLYSGALREPADGGSDGAILYRSVDTTFSRDGAGEVHYGVVFEVPAGRDLGVFGKCSRWRTDTQHHQSIDYWALIPLGQQGRTQYVQMFIPRTWLIRNGFLTPLAALMRSHRFRIWNEAEFKRGFWLESPE